MQPQLAHQFINSDSLNKENRLITREGKEIDISSDTWHLPYSTEGYATLRFNKIVNTSMREALKAYAKDRLRRVSTSAGYRIFYRIRQQIFRYWIEEEAESDGIDVYLIKLFEAAINRYRAKRRLDRIYDPVQWYLWCTENCPEYGFSEEYAQELEALEIPGGPRGEAVRMEDPVSGPLHRSLELPLLISALKSDTGTEMEHLQQKVVVALSIAFGRNPANLTFLREADLVALSPGEDDPCYVLKMPRIKKRLLSPRDDLLDEYLDPYFGRLVAELIEFNQSISLQFEGKRFVTAEERPLLIKQRGNQAAIRSYDLDNIFNMASADITRLVADFVKRHNIISPLTGELMHVTSRRLRYTLATGLAEEGISKRELARILDHSDTQHVQVYFEMAGRVVTHLDKAAAKGFAQYLRLFKGKLIDHDGEAVNGERDDEPLIFINEENPEDQSDIGVCGESNVCHLDPPFSCYLCPKFQPYRHADHEHVLDCLLSNREERLDKYENARLGVQLDEVIAAVAQVVTLCEQEESHA